jgi:Ca2+/H+ antiporter
MKKLMLSKFEYVILSVVLLIVSIGIISFQIDPDWFVHVYVVEDGLIENLTVVALLVGSFTAVSYLTKYAEGKSRWYKRMMVLVALATFFVAGEEISWGQRIFNVESPEFFQANNAQQETNIHNMVVGGKKVNKIVFSQMLYGSVGLYLSLFPYLYNRKRTVRKWVDRHGIPVPQWYQSLSCLILFVSILFIPHGKNAEILEVGITYLFMLILLFPRNIHLFRPALDEEKRELINPKAIQRT